jgi:hypothetical protein
MVVAAVAGIATMAAAIVALRRERPRFAGVASSESAISVASESPAAKAAPEASQALRARPMATHAEAAVTATSVARTEPSLMRELRELGETDPALSLRLAREGNDRFPGSADAAERGWIVVKSLVNMSRFDEARAEALTMVENYRGTWWAGDVERHLLINPLYPDEKGGG